MDDNLDKYVNEIANETAKEKTVYTRKTSEEKLKEFDLKMQQLKAQKENFLQMEKERERRGRNKRLIEKGALSEKYFDCKTMSKTDYELLLKKLVSIPEVKEIISDNK